MGWKYYALAVNIWTHAYHISSHCCDQMGPQGWIYLPTVTRRWAHEMDILAHHYEPMELWDGYIMHTIYHPITVNRWAHTYHILSYHYKQMAHVMIIFFWCSVIGYKILFYRRA